MRVCVAGPAETHSKGPPGLPAAAGRSADLAELPLLHQRGDRPPQDCCHHSEGRGVCVTVCPIMCSACTPQCECGGVKAELRWRWTIRWKEKNCPLVFLWNDWLLCVETNDYLTYSQSIPHIMRLPTLPTMQLNTRWREVLLPGSSAGEGWLPGGGVGKLQEGSARVPLHRPAALCQDEEDGCGVSLLSFVLAMQRIETWMHTSKHNCFLGSRSFICPDTRLQPLHPRTSSLCFCLYDTHFTFPISTSTPDGDTERITLYKTLCFSVPNLIKQEGGFWSLSDEQKD